MKGVVAGLALAATIFTLAAAGDKRAGQPTYYVQLVRGSDRNEAPLPGSRRVGPKLASAFNSVFRPQTYWEVGHQEVRVPWGRSARVRLNKEREVEIDLRSPDQRRVT